jgi:hypothetical protein
LARKKLHGGQFRAKNPQILKTVKNGEKRDFPPRKKNGPISKARWGFPPAYYMDDLAYEVAYPQWGLMYASLVFARTLYKYLSIAPVDQYYHRRLLHWAGHVSYMPKTRAPR